MEAGIMTGASGSNHGHLVVPRRRYIWVWVHDWRCNNLCDSYVREHESGQLHVRVYELGMMDSNDLCDGSVCMKTRVIADVPVPRAK